MGENSKCVQFICFKTSPVTTINEELFQEVWIPRAQEFRVRGIDSILLSCNAEATSDPGDNKFVSKTWWDSPDALHAAFPDGFKYLAPRNTELLGLHTAPINAPITLTQLGCFDVQKIKVADKDVDPNRYKNIDKGDIKLLIMFTSHDLDLPEITSKAEKLCLIKGFESYCIYKLDKQCTKATSNSSDELCTWLIEVFFQEYFKSSLLQEVHDTGEFNDCHLTMTQDVIEIKV